MAAGRGIDTTNYLWNIENYAGDTYWHMGSLLTSLSNVDNKVSGNRFSVSTISCIRKFQRRILKASEFRAVSLGSIAQY